MYFIPVGCPTGTDACFCQGSAPLLARVAVGQPGRSEARTSSEVTQTDS